MADSFWNAPLASIRTAVENDRALLWKADDLGRTPLQLACHEGLDLDVIQCLLRAYPDALKRCDIHGYTPLHSSIRGPDTDLDVVQLLLSEEPTLIHSVTRQGWWLAIHLACASGASAAVVTYLMDFWTESLRNVTENGRLPLHCLVARNFTENTSSPIVKSPVVAPSSNASPSFEHESDTIVKMLVERYPEGLAQADRDGCFPIHLAVQVGAPLSIVKRLVRAVPSALRVRNSSGWIPLYEALQHLSTRFVPNATGNFMDTIRFLVQSDPELISSPDDQGEVAIHFACRLHRLPIQIAILLIDQFGAGLYMANHRGQIPLHLAVEKHVSRDLIELLVVSYPDGITRIDAEGQTPLLVAVRNVRSNAFLMYLLAETRPQAVSIADQLGRLPLHCACHRGGNNLDSDFVRRLLFHHPAAVRHHQNKSSLLPLHVALDHDCELAIVKLLVESDPSTLRTRVENGNLALHWAFGRRSWSGNRLLVVKYLIASDPWCLCQPDDDGKLPLHHASLAGRERELLSLMIDEHPETLEHADSRGRLALHCSIEGRAPLQVVELLLDRYPAAIHLTDETGRLPLALACHLDASIDVVYTLLKSDPTINRLNDLL